MFPSESICNILLFVLICITSSKLSILHNTNITNLVVTIFNCMCLWKRVFLFYSTTQISGTGLSTISCNIDQSSLNKNTRSPIQFYQKPEITLVYNYMQILWLDSSSFIGTQLNLESWWYNFYICHLQTITVYLLVWDLYCYAITSTSSIPKFYSHKMCVPWHHDKYFHVHFTIFCPNSTQMRYFFNW